MRIKTMLEAELNNGSKTVYFGNGKVGDNVVQSIYVQVLDDVTVTLTGTMNNDEDPVSLAAISMADMSKVSSLDDKGIYLVIAEPLTSLTLSSSGEVDVIVKAIG